MADESRLLKVSKQLLECVQPFPSAWEIDSYQHYDFDPDGERLFEELKAAVAEAEGGSAK